MLELAGPAALAAGVLAIAVPAAIERFGGILGGILGTMPSTICWAASGSWAFSVARARWSSPTPFTSLRSISTRAWAACVRSSIG